MIARGEAPCRFAIMFFLATVCAFPIVGARAAESSQVEATTHAGERVVPSRFDGDVRDLPRPARPPSAKPYRPLLRPARQPKTSLPQITIPEAPQVPVPLAPMPSPAQNFAGLSFSDSCSGGQCGNGWPPDPNGDVGPNHYIQAVNSAYAIWSKTGTLLASFTEDQLWSSSATICNGSSQGDPVVVYDALADRWLLSHFAFNVDGSGNPISPFYQCVAVSKTGDPVSGGWYLYPLRMDPGGAGQPPVGTFNDYAKLGIWTDCLYLSANGFSQSSGSFVGAIFASLSRADMYSGAALTWSVEIGRAHV